MTHYDVEVGVIVGVFGVRGEVRVRHFTEKPGDILRFRYLYDTCGNTYEIQSGYALNSSKKKGEIIVRIRDIITRNDAKLLVGTLLVVRRDELPPTNVDEFYYTDLIGDQVSEYGEDKIVGIVHDVFFAGSAHILDVLYTATDKHSLYPMTRNFIHKVDIAHKHIIVYPICEV